MALFEKNEPKIYTKKDFKMNIQTNLMKKPKATYLNGRNLKLTSATSLALLLASCGGSETPNAGPSEIRGDDLANTLIGTPEPDTIFGLDGDDIITGLASNDSLFGGEGNDTLDGGTGNDVLQGGSGGDVLNGGAGIDTASYEGSSVAVNVSLITNIGIGGDAEGDTLTSIENLTGSNFNDTLIGNAAANLLSGIGGNDVLEGGGGNDVLRGGSGADVLNGGADIDTASYGGSSTAVNVSLITNLGIGGDAEGDILISIENLTGSSHNDTLIGNANANIIRGGDGNDLITGGDGDDELFGENGSDTFFGGAGADKIDGGDGQDFLTYALAPSAIAANLELGQGQFGIALGDTYVSIENLVGSDFDDALIGNDLGNALYGNGGNDLIHGRAGDDLLSGSSGNDRLEGGQGEDQLLGGNGDDLLIGGSGADNLDGGGGIDTASYEGSSAAVTINLFQNTASGGDAEGDTLTSIENLTGSSHNDFLYGNADANILRGGDGHDFLYGGNGDSELFGEDGHDHLYGGQGEDRLFGGSGNDQLVSSSGADVLNGGVGNDWAIYTDSTSAVFVSLTSNTGSGGDAEGDTLTSIENLAGSSFNDVLFGDANTNILRGGVGDDSLFGYAGGDTLSGYHGNDFLVGGTGADLLAGGSGVDKAVLDGLIQTYVINVSKGSIEVSSTGLGADGSTEMLYEIELLQIDGVETDVANLWGSLGAEQAKFIDETGFTNWLDEIYGYDDGIMI